MKKLMHAVISAILIAALSVGCASPAASQPAGNSGAPSGETTAPKVRTIQVGHVNPSKDTDQFQMYAVLFQKNLSEISGGAFQVEIMGDAQLGGDRDMMEGLQMGTMDMGLISNFSVGLFCPVYQIFNLPYLFETKEEAYEIFDNRAVMDPLAQELYDTCSIKLLSFAEGGFRYMLNNKRPISKVEDMKGLKMRLPETPIYVDAFKAWGSNPTTMAYTETFAAVQQGTVDGLEIPLGSIHSSGYYEICKYLSMTEHFTSPIGVMVSKNVWESLSDEEKGWFQEAADKTTAEHRIRFAEVESTYLDDIKASGIAVNDDVDKAGFRAAAQPVYDAYRAEFGGDILDMIEK